MAPLTQDEVEEIDVVEEWKELATLEKAIKEENEKSEGYLNEIGYMRNM